MDPPLYDGGEGCQFASCQGAAAMGEQVAGRVARVSAATRAEQKAGETPEQVGGGVIARGLVQKLQGAGPAKAPSAAVAVQRGYGRMQKCNLRFAAWNMSPLGARARGRRR